MQKKKYILKLLLSLYMALVLSIPISFVQAQEAQTNPLIQVRREEEDDDDQDPRKPVSPDTGISTANQIGWVAGGILLSFAAYYAVIYIFPFVDDDQ